MFRYEAVDDQQSTREAIKTAKRRTGIRVTPNVYTTVDEVDRFAEAMEAVIRG